MDLDKYLNKTGYTTDDLAFIPSVGAVINTQDGNVFPIMADSSIDFSDGMNVKDMYEDQFSSEEWFLSLHTCDKPVVDKTLRNLGITTFTTFF